MAGNTWSDGRQGGHGSPLAAAASPACPRALDAWHRRNIRFLLISHSSRYMPPALGRVTTLGTRRRLGGHLWGRLLWRCPLTRSGDAAREPRIDKIDLITAQLDALATAPGNDEIAETAGKDLR